MPAINYGDTAWMLVSTALVMAMTAPGLAMFYGGLVRRKNVLSTMMQSFFMLCMSASSGCSSATAWPSARTSATSSATCRGSA